MTDYLRLAAYIVVCIVFLAAYIPLWIVVESWNAGVRIVRRA